MSSNLMKSLNKLIEFNKISDNLSSIQEKFNNNTKSILNFDSNVQLSMGLKSAEVILKLLNPIKRRKN